MQNADSFQTRLLKNYLSSFIHQAGRELQQKGNLFNHLRPGLDTLIAFKNHLEKAFRQEKGVNYYAQKFFVSNKTLTNALIAAIGKTPKQMIDERVMLEAKRLLAHSGEAAKTIALYLGFNEPTNFNKFFKKHSGETPSEFQMINKLAIKVAKVSS